MSRQLESQALITPVAKSMPLSARQTYEQLGTFLSTLPLSPARTQLERLADSLGVEAGLIAPSESSRRETKRKEERAAAKAERRRRRAQAAEAAEKEGMEGVVEELEEREDEMGRSDGGGGEREDDIEYGDVVDEDGEDQPDRQMDEDSD